MERQWEGKHGALKLNTGKFLGPRGDGEKPQNDNVGTGSLQNQGGGV